MRKILPVFLVAILFLVLHTKAFAADSTIGDCTGPDKKHFQTTKDACDAFNKAWKKPSIFVAAASTPAVVLDQTIASTSSTSPKGDCLGPDGNHFQATKEVCDTFNTAWGKKTRSFEVGKASPLPPVTPISVVIAEAEANGSPLIDCVGPDKKHFQAAKEVCDTFNISWKKKPAVPIIVGAIAPTDLSQTIKTSLEKGSPLGDCVGPDKKHFDATKEVCDAFNKNWGKSASFNPGKTNGVGIQSAVIVTGSGSAANPVVTGAEGPKSSGSSPKSGSSVSNSGSSSNGSSNAGKSSESSGKNTQKSDSKKGSKGK